MDLPPIPAPLLALLDESRDLARRMVAAHETIANAALLLALDRYADHIAPDPAGWTKADEQLAPRRVMVGRALLSLGQRLTTQAAIRGTPDQAEHPENDPQQRPATPAERQAAHRTRRKGAPSE